ncbi:MAG: serine/threonine protein kinase, partial [Acidimicrobiales bacterium]|nr:serine/threonine protein kinase [Acidimicrobiales bacterium]
MCAWCGRALAAPAELAEGTRLSDGRYQILRVIGRGGFGITYDVGDRRLQRRVAMKELFPESAVRHGSLVLTPPQGRAGFRAARDRFLREARVLARFTHPGIVRVYEVFEEHGTAYLVMELLQGRTLVELLQAQGRPFAEPELLDVAGRVAAALRPVHAAGVLHRDVNPSNVMMTSHGRIVVIDFGLARDYDEGQTVGMTRVVTPGYAPIEQYRGEGRFGPSTDVYGLAATCYRLATGKVPMSALEREGGGLLVSPRALNPELSKPVSDAILDGLELEPGHRPQDLDGFLSRLGIRRLPEGPRSILLETAPPMEVPPIEVAPPDVGQVGTARGRQLLVDDVGDQDRRPSEAHAAAAGTAVARPGGD